MRGRGNGGRKGWGWETGDSDGRERGRE